jgi:hypothetical protein
MKMKTIAVLLIAALLVAFAAPVFADQAVKQELEVRLKVGSTQMKVGGQAVKITAPYTASGTIMLPMAVFTQGLGAKLTLKNNKAITLAAAKHTVVVTIGSKTATVDGKKLTLPAVPAIHNGVTFAPIRIAQWLGANVTTDASTQEIRITATAAGTATPETSGIDSDSGKSQIGDSYYQWSMNYPTGLSQDYQSEDGDALVFRDVKQEYYLGVSVEAAPGTLSTDDKRELMSKYLETGETVLDRRTVTGTGNLSYEKLVSKNKLGFIYESRGIQANGYFYIVSFGKKAASPSELAPHTAILDSFKPIFNGNDRTLKDLSKIKDGMKTLQNADYGLTVNLPKEWKANDKDYSYPYFETNDAFLSTQVSSLEAGDTLEAWVKRDTDRFRDVYLEPYRRIDDAKPIVWNGKPALLVKISYANDTKAWWHNYQIYSIQGQYRYYTVFGIAEGQNDQSDTLFDSILHSLKLDYSVVEKNFGLITDDTDLTDRAATVTKTSHAYGYSLALPKFWFGEKKDFEDVQVLYHFPGGMLQVQVIPDVKSVPEYMAQLDKYFSDEQASNPDIHMVSNTTLTFAGKTAQKFVVEDKSNTDMYPNVDTGYIVEQNGTIYVVEGWYYLANATDFVKNQLETAMNSFAFNP